MIEEKELDRYKLLAERLIEPAMKILCSEGPVSQIDVIVVLGMLQTGIVSSMSEEKRIDESELMGKKKGRGI